MCLPKVLQHTLSSTRALGDESTSKNPGISPAVGKNQGKSVTTCKDALRGYLLVYSKFNLPKMKEFP